MTNEELLAALITNVREGDTDKILDPDGDGHYAFTITGYVRPNTNAGELEDQIGCATFTLGVTEGTTPGEQLAALATKQVMTEKAPEIMAHIQKALTKRKELWND